MTVREIGDELARTPPPLRARTIQAALKLLVEAGLVEVHLDRQGAPGSWRAVT
jgi:Fe2+ or Zn2+ uptake regulation protein